ncbi:hypothetical protein [Salegentibacter flavus]|uniref:Uncharacterized protein n=1 Tax=Salegentibacter flavus TaxID=287099 RepID=A0A1I5B753_9FLAO|nr:hypothetical protein [Salegentibacter flavus]SFN70537.1 hypothetical protein SAMN05660413_02225 [Salegentibacter flavus]
MIDKFQEHFDEQEVQMLSIESESSEWEERLKSIETEAAFYSKLLNSGFSEDLKLKINLEDSNYLKNHLKSMREINDFHLKTFQDYKIKQEGLKECDDVQYENFYLKDHLIFKQTLIKHFKVFREFKSLIYKYIEINFGK